MQYEMKDSGVEWIGQMPEGWTVERLKALFMFGKGLPITKEDLVEHGIPVISYGQIHAKFNTGVEVLPQLLRYVDDKWLESNAGSLVSEGDFIFADTSEDLEGCGNCVYIDSLDEGSRLFAGYHTITFKPKKSKRNKYLAYLFKSDAWRIQLRSRVSGVKLFSISRRMLNLATVILPPSEEQAAIADYLDDKCSTIDDIIAEAKATIEEYKAWKSSVIFEAVTKGLAPDAEMVDSGFDDIGRIPAHWRVVRLKNCYDVVCGATPGEDPRNWDGDIEWIGPADMGDFGKIKSGKRKITQSGYDSCGTHIIPAGTVVLSTRAPIGKIQITEDELCTNQGCKSMVKKAAENSETYLAYFLHSIKERLQVAGTGTTFKELSTFNLKNMPFLLLPTSEQEAIAVYLDDKCAAIDGVIAEKEALIAELETYKKSLIFETVTGKRQIV